MTARDWLEGTAFVIVYFLAIGICDPAPAAILDRAAQSSGANRMDRYLTEAEQVRLLKVLKEAGQRDALGRRDDAAVRALVHSGLRIGEFLKVSLGDALSALRDDYLFVPREHRKGHSAGTAKDHRVYATAPLKKALRDLISVRAELAPGDARVADPLVVGRTGQGMTVRAFELRYAEHAEAAGVGRSTPHWLRHTRGQNILRHSTARDPIGIVQRALGHIDIRSSRIYAATTREDYESALIETDRAAAGRLTRAQLRQAWEARAA